ncbi:hypothetical protein BCR32DRAFT_270045 [Anaeromyces robustus]|uniref:Inhibitor I9 domain-containing protein n=1 Tax=Anaeromyces robustus TaxID=1754192 RepID=A0A1Y1WYU2_9FUNG|nr:hypothetical protein BCR32DRAFT_270045 [Anaeromyces robustus]|eukprot:ORX78518.1 hypothetical protein BCR32DRAFT_270045 [Anaeromyces robustus]
MKVFGLFYILLTQVLFTFAITPKKGENYIIHVQNPNPELEETSPEFNKFVQYYIDEFGQTILNNLDTYEDQSSLTQFQNEFVPVLNGEVSELHNYDQSFFMHTYDTQCLFMAYLNENILDKIKSISNVLSVEKELDEDEDEDENENEDDTYENDIENPAPTKGNNYIVYVQNPEVEKNSPEFNQYIQYYTKQFNDIITNNLNTYDESKSDLERFKSFFIKSTDEQCIFIAYLNEKIIDQVKGIPNVLNIEEDINDDFTNSINPIEEKETNNPIVPDINENVNETNNPIVPDINENVNVTNNPIMPYINENVNETSSIINNEEEGEYVQYYNINQKY